MIIDEILDLKDGYKKEVDLDYIYNEAKIFNFDDLTEAIENGNNKDIQRALINYITTQNYNSSLVEFIKKTTFRNKNTKKTYYFVEDDNYGQHGDYIEEIKLNKQEYNYANNNRQYNGRRGFLTDNYASAVYYTND